MLFLTSGGFETTRTLVDPGAPLAPHPQWDSILSFSHNFCQKSSTLEVGDNSPAPKWVGTPQWEILDLPLNNWPKEVDYSQTWLIQTLN